MARALVWFWLVQFTTFIGYVQGLRAPSVWPAPTSTTRALPLALSLSRGPRPRFIPAVRVIGRNVLATPLV